VGGSGFLGRNLACWLRTRGHPVALVCRTPPAPPHIPATACHLEELCNLPQRGDILDHIDTIIHLVHSSKPAGSMRDIPGDIIDNVPDSVRLMQAAQEHGIRRMLFISSGGTVYGVPRYLPIDETHPTDPVCSYGITKLAIEKYLGMFSVLNPAFTGISLRVSNPYGPFQPCTTGQGVIAHFLDRIRRDEPLDIWGDGTVVRDFIHVQDVLEAISAVLDHHLPAGVYNLGSEQGHSLNQIIDLLRHVAGRPVTVNYHPGRVFDIPRVVLSTARLRAALPWKPRIDMQSGLAALWSHAQS